MYVKAPVPIANGQFLVIEKPHGAETQNWRAFSSKTS